MSKPFAAKIVDLLGLARVASLAVAGEGGVAYSESFPLPNDSEMNLAFEYQFTSPGVVAVKVELEQGNQEPSEEGAADTSFVVPDGAAELDNSCGDEITHIKAYSPAATAFARLKFTGLATNNAGTTATKLKVSMIKR